MYSADDRAEAAWRWIVALGILVLALSCAVAYSIGAAGSASMSLIGALMVLASGAQIIQAFEVYNRRAFRSCLVSGALYCFAGLLAIANPTFTAHTLVLMLALALVASGFARAWWTFARRPEPGWRSIAASGAATVLVGIVFAIGWPQEPIWVVGTLLAMDLAWQGIMTIAFAVSLKPR